MITMLVALVALPFIFYLPGLLLASACGVQQPADAVARWYERVVASVLLSGWLALLLAEAGLFSLPLLLCCLLLCCLPLALLAYRRGGLRSSGPLGLVAGQARPESVALPVVAARWQAIAYVGVLLLGALTVARPFEVLLGGRDAGIYAATGLAIARTGAIVQHDALLQELAQERATVPAAAQAYSNFFSSQNPERFIATRLRAAGFFVEEGDAEQGRVVPQFLHLFPTWIAVLASMFGPYAGLAATGLMATLGLWGVMLLGRQLAGPAVGLLAGLLLALNGVQIWFGRYSTSEATSQFLTFAALYAFARWQAPRDETARAETRERRPETARSEGLFYAALCGLAAGQLALNRIDFFLVVGPLALFLAYAALSRRWQAAHWALLLSLAAMLLHAVLHIAFVARAYFFDTAYARLQDYAITAYLSLPFQTEVLKTIYYGRTNSPLKDPMNLVWELAALALLLLGALLLRRFPQPLLLLERLLQKLRRPLLALGATGLLLLGAYGYMVRPQILNADLLLNMRGGWGDPLLRDPGLLRDEVLIGVTSIGRAREDYGVVFRPVVADASATEVLRREGTFGKIEGKRELPLVVADVERGRVSPPRAASVYGVALAPLEVDAPATAVRRAELLAARGPWRGPLSEQSPNWLRLQGYIGAPVEFPPGTDPRYTIAYANMVRVGWYLSPLGVLLAVLGLALWLWRGLTRASWLFLAVALLAGIFYIRQSYGTADQTYIYILRRFMPVVYPAACLGIAYALLSLWRMRGRAGRVLAVGLAVGLVAFLAATNAKLVRHVEYGGAIAQLQALAERFEPNAVVIFRGGGTSYIEIRDVPELAMMPLRFAFGRDALVVKSEQPGRYATDLAAQVTRWHEQGRPVYMALGANGGSFALPGVGLDPVGRFELRAAEFEQLTAQKPHNVGELRLPFALYRALPGEQPAGLAAAVVGPESFAAQLRGFYRSEAGYAWTNDDAVLRLPRTGTALRLRLGAGQRPSTLGPSRVCVGVAAEATPWLGAARPRDDDPPFAPLGCVDVGPTPGDYRFALGALAVSPSDTMLVRLTTTPWVPAQVDPALHDQRLLGVQLYEAAVE